MDIKLLPPEFSNLWMHWIMTLPSNKYFFWGYLRFTSYPSIYQESLSTLYYIQYIYIIYPVILEYRIEILASQGIPIIELENSYLEYS